METAHRIRVVIDASGAKTGAAQVNQALTSIGSTAKRTAANNNELSKSHANIGKSAVGAASSAGKLNTALGAQSSVIGSIRNALSGASGEMGRLGSVSVGATNSVGALTGTFRGLAAIGAPGIIAGIAVALTAVGVASLKAAAQVQQFKANLLTMTGSAEAADAAYAGLVEFANKTPFDLSQSIEGFTKLRSLGLSTSEDIMTSYGNTSAAMGKSMSQMIEAVADATTGEFERLKEFGIKSSKEGDKVKFTFQGVTTEVKNNAAEIEKYLIGIGNTQFAGAMERQMNGLNGAFANLEDTLFTLMASLGDGPFGDAIADMINTVANGIGAITPLLSGIMDLFGGIISAVWDVTKGLTSMFTGGSQGASDFQSLLDGLAVAFAFVGETAAVLGSAVGQVFGAIGDGVGWVVGSIRDLFSGLFGDLFSGWNNTGQSVSENIVGWLRAAQHVVKNMGSMFTALGNDIVRIFSQIGSAFTASLNGDFSKWGEISLKPSGYIDAYKKLNEEGLAIWKDQKANRAWIDSRTSKGTKGNIDFDAARGGATAAGKGKGKGDGDKEAKAVADKAKAQKEFWEGLEKELDLSKLTTLEVEKRRKEMEIEKITGQKIGEIDAQRLKDGKLTLQQLQDQIKVNQFLQKSAEDHRTKMIDLEGEQAVLKARIGGATTEQLEVEKAIQDAIADLKKQNVTLDETQLEILRKRIAGEQQLSSEIAKQNKMLDMAKALASEHSKSQRKTDRNKEYADQSEALKYALDNKQISQKIYDETIKGMKRAIEETRLEAVDKFTQSIYEISDVFGGKLGKVLNSFADKMNDIVGSLQGKSGIGLLAKKLGVFDEFKGTLKGWFGAGGALDLKGTFNKLFGNNGTLIKGLGKTLGAAGAGAQVGQTIAGFGKMISSKFSTTGSTLGGAVGGAVGGPIGAIAGSIIGGVFGGLLKKAKWGTSAVQMGADGELVAGEALGNKGAFKKNANSAAGSIVSGLQQIADSLGATISGTPSVSIGQYKGKWRVSDTGRTGKLKSKYGDVTDFGKDGAEAAIAFAISEALRDGVLTGISDFSQRVLKTLGDTDKALSLAQSYEAILKSIKAYKNPIRGAVDEVIGSIDKLAESMKKAGATSEELANVEEYRSIKLQEVLESQVSGFKDFLDELNGKASGKSALTLMNEEMSKMADMRKTLESGGIVDQSKFTELGQSILGYANEIYGTQTASYQSIRRDLIAVSELALGNAAGEFASAATKGDSYTAITTQTDMVTASISATNDLLSRILSVIEFGRTVSSTLNGTNAVNGQLINYN